MMKKNYLKEGILAFVFLAISAGGVYSFITLSALKEFKFNHKLHAKMSEIDCSSCHEDKGNGLMSFPTHESCAMCHDEVEKKDSCKLCHIKEPKKKVFRQGKAFADLSFDHKIHENNGIKCLECHKNMDKRIGLHANESLPDMGTCQNCHNKKGNLNAKNCEFCHPKNFAMVKPLSHSPIWKKEHGYGLHRDEDAKNCKYCHNGSIQKNCVECHKTEAPQSHTISFIKKRHGQISMMERQKCMICHEQQTCLQCHKNSPPMSHTAMYGSPYNRHCNNCHLTGSASAVAGSSSNCYFCHIPAMTNTLHLAKAILPPGHLKANCLGCHRFGGGSKAPAVKHPAYGSDNTCLQCHR